ncbi:hypothetical protein TNCT1_41320 [Streptomyces sp. 1-11]|nr:hypothetical protein TNCT1_41320 [Streptomyces sp. 1-11]
MWALAGIALPRAARVTPRPIASSLLEVFADVEDARVDVMWGGSYSFVWGGERSVAKSLGQPGGPADDGNWG